MATQRTEPELPTELRLSSNQPRQLRQAPPIGEPGRTWASLTSTMALRRLDVHGLSMLQYPANELEGGLTNLWLLVDGIASPLLGPGSRGTTEFDEQRAQRRGTKQGIDWVLGFELISDPMPGWRWQVQLINRCEHSHEVVLVLAHDIALAPYEQVRVNEYYVSQYLDVTPVSHVEFGTALAVRQNMPGEQAPWVAIASLEQGQAWASDARQLVKRPDGRPSLDPLELPSTRCQHEHTLATLATAERQLAPGERLNSGFVAVVLDDHPAATGPQDAELISSARQRALDLPYHLESDPASPVASAAEPDRDFAPSGSLFDAAVLNGQAAHPTDLSRWFPGEHRQLESGPDGQVWAFAVGDEHVVLPAKEAAVLRPHGHILRTGSALTAETGVLTSTLWLDGVFTSQLTVGHVAHGSLLSGRRTYLGLQAAHGLRIFVEFEGRWYRLGLPSAWAISTVGARWCYRLAGGEIVVRVTAATNSHQIGLSVTAPDSISRTLLAMHLALGADDGQSNSFIAPITRELKQSQLRLSGAQHCLVLDTIGTRVLAVGGDELLFGDGISRAEPWSCMVAEGPVELTIAAEARTGDQLDSELWTDDLWPLWRERLHVSGGQDSSLVQHIAALNTQIPWFQHNAMVHYLSPRGLEQFTGGAWGTRDVCQGPIGLLTAMGRDDAVRDVLLRIFAAQRSSGDWPQAFDFLPTSGAANQQISHGDVIYWPLQAMGDYLSRTGDASILDEAISAAGETMTVAKRLKLALAAIADATIDGSPLPAYGHGDWNDSLQPADPKLAEQMVSTWTATLKIETLRSLAAGLTEVGRESNLATHCAALACQTQAAMLEELLVDGELAGYGVTPEQPGAGLELLVHPRDQRTGLSHGLLAWIHAIAGDQLSPEQARDHLRLIERHLLGPDGARLFDTPPAYRGGPMKVFQRAEAATFWGREIGLMYTHAHLRYCQALARLGAAEELLEALLLSVPTGLDQRSPRSRPRQSTCYFSSSDAVFADREDAARRYPDLLAGLVDLEGGWRIYSSGPGLFLQLLVENVLGVRRRPDRLEIDPVLPPGLAGLEARVPLDAGCITLRYHFEASPQPSVSPSGDSQSQVVAVLVDGQAVPLTPLSNPYRKPGGHIPRDRVSAGAILDVYCAGASR